jgi:tRNA pseudouridine32 synthase/23S rRNA pseudouridine746 synthase
MGHAILGDNLYAAPDALASATRLCLHATELAFEGTRHTAPHPF